MRDPHVQRLYFEIGSGEGISYENPEPLTFKNSLGQFDARGGNLLVEPADHFANEDAAREIIEAFLRDWEIETDLDSNPGTIHFKFVRADVIDRDPPPPGSGRTIQLKGSAMLTLAGTATMMLIKRQYPRPPGAFQATVDVARAHARWLDYRSGREPLQGMGYFVLTLATAAGLKKASQHLQIDEKLLRKIGELTSTKGNPKTARKAPPSGQFQDLTGAERAWLEAAIRKLIKRLGERASGAALTMLTLRDLPKL